MQYDARGVPVSCSDRSALDLYEKALVQYHSYVGDPIATIDEALKRRPDFVLGHVFRATVLMTITERRFAADARASVASAEALLSGANSRERGLAAAARRLVDGDWDDACAGFDRGLVDHPRDAFAIQSAHLMDFYRGDALNLRNRISRVLPHWSPSVPSYSYVLGMHAFGLEECNQYPQAEETGRRALALQPKDGWAVHAVTHVMEMEGRIDEGIEWLESRETDWAPDSGFAFHLWWHLGLYYLDRQQYERVLSVYDARVHPEPPETALQLLDATALLWRLYLEGVDIGRRGEVVADNWARRLEIERGFYAFNDMHAMMAFTMAGREKEAARLMEDLEWTAKNGTGVNVMMTGEVGLPVCEAIQAFGEAELFGFERGAFTDARQAKAGLFQAAHRGTIFLDEIGLLPEVLQGKLLKVIEELSVRRLGSTKSEPVDVWVMAATSEDLLVATRTRRFREDLYHRLAVVTLRLPPLRERADDILLLAEHFLAQACEDYGLAQKVLAPGARTALMAYPWPGNVRELANVMERVALLSDASTVTADELRLVPPHPRASAALSVADEWQSAKEAEASAERERLLEALRATTWNLSRAAARLGIPRNTLRYRMEKYELSGASTAPQARRRGARAEAPAEPGPQAPAAPSGTPEPGRPVAVRWEPRRITLLRARLVSPRLEPGSSEASRAMEVVLDKLGTFGGRVDELSAMSVVAAFGLEPVEDAPRHAAYAAMAIQKVAGRARREDPTRPGVALAIHTEPLAVGRVGEDLRIDAEARRPAGAILEILAERAEPGTVVVSPAAAGFIARRFELVPVGAIQGVPGEAYQLVGSREAERGLARFVGREAELALLRQRFEQARAGQGQVVSIVGEPGIGKSRLLREFRRELSDATWVEGQAISYGRAMPFHPLIDMLRRTFAIDDADPEAAVVEKIERNVGQLGEGLRPAVPFLRYLLSVDPGDPRLLAMDPKLRRAEIFDVMRHLFLQAAEARPLVVVWEDLHWTDQATEEFVGRLAESLATQRILMVLTYRPGYAAPVGDRTFHTRLALAALSVADSVEMARRLFAAPELPEALQALIVRKAEGNPFFMEEMVRSLLEMGAVRQEGERLLLARTLDEVVVPDTIEDLILARIDRLEDAPKEALQVASAIGREFTRRLLDRLAAFREQTEELLRELKAVELIYEKSAFPELAYTFKHALIHEVAYGSLRAQRRKELHRLIGFAIEELYGERLAEHYEVLAHHFSRAEEWSKALEYLLRAAEKAARSFAIREALALYDQALDAARRQSEAVDPITAMTVHQAKSALYFVLSEFDRSRGEGERWLDLARQVGDRKGEAAALAAIAWSSMWARDLDGAITYAGQAIDVAEPAGAQSIAARGHFTIGFVRAVTGALDDARHAIEKALAVSRSTRDIAHHSLSLTVAGLLKNWEGEFVEAARLQADGLALAREHNLLVPLLLSFFLHGLTLTGKGDYDAGLATFQEGLALSERVGDEAIHHRLLNCLGWLYAEVGDLDRAADLNRRSAETGRKRGDPGTRPNAEINLGDIYLAKGDLALAGELFESAYRFWDNPATSQWMRWRYSIRLFASLGELWLARGDPARAEEFANQCLELATRTNSRKNLVKGWRLAGEIAFARRRWQDAETAFRRALAAAEAIGNPTHLWKTHVALAHLYAARGQAEGADEAYRSARRAIDGVKNRLTDPGLRGSLERAPLVREVYTRSSPS